MTQEDKNLLLKDLCARLPYGVICKTDKGDGHLCSINQTIFGTEYGLNINPLKRDYFSDSETEEQVIKPYLRPMSSMTEEERKEREMFVKCIVDDKNHYKHYVLFPHDSVEYHDWLNAHHFDYRHLIEKDLALEAPKEMYK